MLDGFGDTITILKAWFQEKDNQDLAKLAAPTLAAVVAALWAIFTYLRPPKPRSNSQKAKAESAAATTPQPIPTGPLPSATKAVTATDASIAIGDGLSGSSVTVNSGATTEMLVTFFAGVRDLRDETATRIAETRHNVLTEAALKSFFAILHDQDDIRSEDLPRKLAEIATRHMELLEQLDVLRTESPENRQRLDEARAAIERGDHIRAESLLSDVERAEAAAVERAEHLAEEAQNTANHDRRARTEARAERARLCMLRLDYLAAADHYHVAAEALPDADLQERVWYFWGSANALQQYGNEKGSNSSLIRAIELYRRITILAPRNIQPDVWAGLQNSLGNTLSLLGEREVGTARLEEALSAYKSALLEYTRDGDPINWAATQNNLGSTLGTLGQRETGTARLEEAVIAFKSALVEYTRERAPLDWAMVQNNLGNVLLALNKRESGTPGLEEAVIAFNSALLEQTRERTPLDWARTQSNLGTALQALGLGEIGTARLEEAVIAFENALLEQTRERVPLAWATTQHNLGTTLCIIANLENSRERAEQAVAALEMALAVRTEAGASYYIDRTTHNLAHAREAFACLQSREP